MCVVCEKEPCSVTRSSLRAEATVACVTDENGIQKRVSHCVCLSVPLRSRPGASHLRPLSRDKVINTLAVTMAADVLDAFAGLRRTSARCGEQSEAEQAAMLE